MKMDKTRTNVTLHGDDLQLLNKIKALVEKRLKQKVSQAFVIRMALRDLEIVEEA
jgi:hypothetical protein